MITPKANWEAGARLSDLVTDYVLVDPNGTPDQIVFEPPTEKLWWQDRAEDESEDAG